MVGDGVGSRSGAVVSGSNTKDVKDPRQWRRGEKGRSVETRRGKRVKKRDRTDFRL